MWPIFVISLPDAEARRRDLVAALRSRGLDFEVVDAVDGRGGLAPELEAQVDRAGTLRDFGRPMSDTEYACAFSHLSVYRRVVADAHPGAVVLEDDAILTPLFDEFLASEGFLKGDLIQLDHLHGDVWRGARAEQVTKNIRLVPAARNATLTTGYTISRTGAAYFLDRSLPLTRTADWPADALALGVLLALPRVVDHPPFDLADSAIHKGRRELEAGIPKDRRALRFFKASYWKRWWFKRRTRRVS